MHEIGTGEKQPLCCRLPLFCKYNHSLITNPNPDLNHPVFLEFFLSGHQQVFFQSYDIKTMWLVRYTVDPGQMLLCWSRNNNNMRISDRYLLVCFSLGCCELSLSSARGFCTCWPCFASAEPLQPPVSAGGSHEPAQPLPASSRTIQFIPQQ